MVDSLMGKDQALTEAVAVQATAKNLEEMNVASSQDSLQMASEYLNQLRVEAPGTADMIIESANLWKQIETQVNESQLPALLESSRSIASTENGKKFIRGLSRMIGDKDQTIAEAKNLFNEDQKLNNILSSKPELSNLWYEHLFVTFKMAVAAVEGERSGELP